MCVCALDRAQTSERKLFGGGKKASTHQPGTTTQQQQRRPAGAAPVRRQRQPPASPLEDILRAVTAHFAAEPEAADLAAQVATPYLSAARARCVHGLCALPVRARARTAQDYVDSKPPSPGRSARVHQDAREIGRRAQAGRLSRPSPSSVAARFCLLLAVVAFPKSVPSVGARVVLTAEHH